jgi:hypothetical protein
MNTKRHNQYGCPLQGQTGRDAIKDFDAIIARLSPDQRQAFERERAALRFDSPSASKTAAFQS